MFSGSEVLNGGRRPADKRVVSQPIPPEIPSGFVTPPSAAELRAQFEARFAEVGAFGVVLVDASVLATLERRYGVDAHERAAGALVEVIRECVSSELREGDRLMMGEEGRDEVALVLFRSRNDGDFYAETLPKLAEDLGDHLDKQAGRALYPYVRVSPPLPVGWAIGLRNPTISGARQFGRALAEARDGAQLDGRLDARDRRRDFMRLVLAEEISTLYEPIVDLSNREVLGYEALSRGPAGSAVETPGALFGMAEETDLLFEVDCLCRRNALRRARGLQPGKKLFLNCLPTAIRDPGFRGEQLRRTLDSLRLQPSDVVLEISEKESIDNFTIFREARDHFASLGMGVALDDTGVGYSSLEAVMELAPDFIKVDQVLVRSIDTDRSRLELLRAINALAHSLGAKVIAEGIETSEELATLRELGVPYGQGYLLGRPAPLRRVG